MKNFLEIQEIVLKFDLNGILIRKNVPTFCSKAPDESSPIEEGFLLTFVKKANGELHEESRVKIEEGVIYARNEGIIGTVELKRKDSEGNLKLVKISISNDYLMSVDVWNENYRRNKTDEEPTDEFKPYIKNENIKALIIDDSVLKILGSTEGETAIIAVDWTDSGQVVYRDGALTEKGYGIAPAELKSTIIIV